jgi:hypothetical protein
MPFDIKSLANLITLSLITIKLNVIRVYVIMLSVVMLDVVASRCLINFACSKKVFLLRLTVKEKSQYVVNKL